MKHQLICLFSSIISLMVFNLKSEAQYSFGSNSVSGIKVIVEQESKPLKRLGKVKNDMPTSDSDRLKYTQQIKTQTLVSSNNLNIQNAITPKKNIAQIKTALSVSNNMENIQSAIITNKTSKTTKQSKTTNSTPVRYREVVVYYSNDLFSSGFFQRAYNVPALHDNIAQALKNTLNSGVLKMIQKEGFGIHSNTNLQLGELQVMSSYTPHSITPYASIVFKIPRNRYFVQITTPTIFGSNVDPNAVIFFDLIITIPIQLPVNTSQTSNLPSLGEVTVLVNNISKPESRNWISKLAIEFGPLLSGRDFITELRRDKHFTFPVDQYNNELNRIRRSLTGIPVMRIENHPDGDILVLKATTKPEEQIYLH